MMRSISLRRLSIASSASASPGAYTRCRDPRELHALSGWGNEQRGPETTHQSPFVAEGLDELYRVCLQPVLAPPDAVPALDGRSMWSIEDEECECACFREADDAVEEVSQFRIGCVTGRQYSFSDAFADVWQTGVPAGERVDPPDSPPPSLSYEWKNHAEASMPTWLRYMSVRVTLCATASDCCNGL